MIVKVESNKDKQGILEELGSKYAAIQNDCIFKIIAKTRFKIVENDEERVNIAESKSTNDKFKVFVNVLCESETRSVKHDVRIFIIFVSPHIHYTLNRIGSP
jgi:hypothetical protein